MYSLNFDKSDLMNDESESIFSDYPKNLIVLGDKESGTVALMH